MASKKLVVINDRNYKRFLSGQVVDGDQKSYGLKPRNFKTHPTGYSAAAPVFDLPLMDDAEIADRIKEQEKYQSSLYHVRLRGNAGSPVPSYDQDGVGYCWNHSVASACTALRAAAGEPFVPLSPFMVGCIIKGYRDQGGWGLEAVEFVAKNGMPSTAFWPARSMSRSNDTPEMRANAKLHRFTYWFDCSDNPATRKRQVMTASLLGLPVVADFNWWSHSVCLLRVFSMDESGIWNSWSDNWSEKGFGKLQGRKAWPDGAVVGVALTPAVKTFLAERAPQHSLLQFADHPLAAPMKG